MTSTLKKLFAVSDIHIGTQGAAHAKPRIEAMLSAAWAQMQRDQKEAFLRSEAVRQFIQIPGDTFESLDVDALVTSMNQEELDRQGTIAPELLTPSIDAEAHDSGRHFTANFGAADWFAQANDGGFECCVEAEKEMAGLKIHRKLQWARILCSRHGIKLSRSKDEGSLGRWNWLSDTNQGSEISFDTEDEAALNAVETLGLTD